MKSIELIRKHEGLRLKPYRDTEGILTVGYGRNLEKGISQRVADLLFEEDMNDVYHDCNKLDWYRRLTPARQAVIENMIFNLGYTKFRGFKKTIQYIKDKDFIGAGNEMLRSRWAEQVGNRSVELAQMMQSGVF